MVDLTQLRNGLIVSCQITDEKGHISAEEPMQSSIVKIELAKAAVLGGARAIRVNGATDIRAVRGAVEVPVIGINKQDLPNYEVRITPTLEAAKEAVDSGVTIVALDATKRARPQDLSAAEIIRVVKSQLRIPVMADISTYEEGVNAADAGADLVGTTLSGYTSYSRPPEGPDFELIQRLAEALDIPVIAEGRISTPQQAARALELGAFAVVVGAMIVNPRRITQRFVTAMDTYITDRLREEDRCN